MLTGPIPAALGDLTNLEVLHFRNNQLTGPIPSALGALSNLRWLDVAENALTGMLPPALGSLSTLRALSLSGNRLTGPLPSELTMLPELDYLWVDETGLCAPADATFQTWLAALMQFSGVTCLDFAHFANGADIISDLVLMNVAPHIPVRPVLYFYDQEGHPIAPESMVDLTEDLEVTEDGALTVQTEMEPLGELTISTHGQGVVVSGSVQVVSDGPIGGVLRFDLPGIGVAGVGASQPVRDALFPARRRGGLSTAAAIRNLGEEALVMSCRLMSGGIVLEEVEIYLEANGQDARFIEELFTGTDTSDFVGSVRCTAPGLFTGIAVELDAGNRIFTTLNFVLVHSALIRPRSF